MDIQIGDRVRSFDFVSRDITGENACYVEGIVEDIGVFGFSGCDRYLIRVGRHVFAGEDLPEGDAPRCGLVGQCVYPPINGTRKLFGGICDGVEVIS